jgi:uncharacterized protein YceK
MMKRISRLAVIPVLIGVVGCSSVQIRLAGNRTAIHDPITGIYPAVKRDVKMADHADAGHGIWMGNSSPFCACLYYLDIPLSFVTDTIGLPFDLFRNDKETAQQTSSGDVLKAAPEE